MVAARFLAAVALLLAGCVEPAGEQPLAATAEPVVEDAAAQAPPPASASSEAAVVDTPAAPEASPPVEIEVPVAWDARSRQLVCVPRGVDTCSGPGTANEDREMHAPALPGVPTSFRLTMTWTAASPLTETMALHAIGPETCPDDCAVMGTSPLEFVLDDVHLGEDGSLVFHVFAPAPCWPSCNGVRTFVDPGQDVHVEGVVVVVA